ncbi:MAG: 2-C-methyl-D-erythritol 4-phosphate cytidylyltransferase [Firmicutes bacterium]|nr:2-C-methyl-D-erythritol 4-phosphate cytidylyltransferase [Bacillota bacterium]
MEKSNTSGHTFTAIIPAAGSSRRMQGQNKLLADLAGKPVIIRTLEAIRKDPRLQNIILVTSRESIELFADLTKKYKISGIMEIIEGGAQRQDSVYQGIIKAPGSYVAIHDGARPFPTTDMLKTLLDEAPYHDGVIPGIPVTDTVKKVNADGFVETTLDRNQIFRIQTPQVFRKDLLLKAYEVIRESNLMVTDDASILELAGYRVKITKGTEFNIKITTPQDLVTAEAIFANLHTDK